MKLKKNNMKKLILTAIIILGLTISSSASALIGTNFDILPEQDPLFQNANFMPGDSVSRYVRVTNKTTDSYLGYAWATGVDDSDGLGSALYLTITRDTVIIYQNTLADFFSQSYVDLPEIIGGDTVDFVFSIYFEHQSGNEYQEKSVGFDISVSYGGEGPEPTDPPIPSCLGCGPNPVIIVTPTPTPEPSPSPKATPTPTATPTTSPEATPDHFDGTTSGTIGGDDASDSKGFISTSQNNLLASIFGFLPCGYWLIILLLALMVLTALDKGYTLKRKIYMLVVLLAILILAIMGYIPCNWWIILIVALVLAYLLFRKRRKEEY